MDKFMSATQYAKHRGIAPKNVTKAIEEGRIDAKKSGKKWMINAELADVQWRKNTNMSLQDQQKQNESLQVFDDDDGLPSYSQSRAVKESYLAKLKKLEYEKERGSLIDAEEVKRNAYTSGKLVQQKMLAIPDRLAGQLAGMTDVSAIKRVLVDEIRYALSEVADD